MKSEQDCPGANVNMEVYRAIRDRLSDLQPLDPKFYGEITVSVAIQNGKIQLVRLEEKSVKKYSQTGHVD